MTNNDISLLSIQAKGVCVGEDLWSSRYMSGRMWMRAAGFGDVGGGGV